MILIQQLMSSPAFNTLREQALTDPSSLPNLLQMLQQNYPSLFQLFSQNPQLLVAILSGQVNFQNPGAGDFEGDEGEEDLQPVAEELTAQDHTNIQTLMGMGFSQQQGIEAYLTCDKNMDLAINFLLDNMGGPQ